jgi:histidine triad (HIT) family protein
VASIFTKIINGELPGRFVWRDDRAVAFLTIQPLKPGHTLVVPIEEVDHWLDLEPNLAQHLVNISQQVGKAIDRAFEPAKVGLIIAGLEVSHVHLHVTPIHALQDLNFANADPNPDPLEMDAAAEKIRGALRELGCAEVVDS